jgi:NAD(P)H-flavin reductase
MTTMADASRSARVVGRSALSPRVTEVTLAIEGDEPFRWTAGQHLKLRLELPDGEASAFSIAAAPNQIGLRRLSLALANDSDTLAGAEVGSLVFLDGPFGALTWRAAPGALLVGAGTGLAPLRAIVHDALALDERTPVVLVAGNRGERDLLWHSELVTLASEYPRFRYEPVVSQPDVTWRGRSGRVQAHLEEIARELPAEFRVYLCGSRSMVNECKGLLGTLGVTPERILGEADA